MILLAFFLVYLERQCALNIPAPNYTMQLAHEVSLLQNWGLRWVHFSCSVTSDPLQPHGLQPTRLLCPLGFSGKNTGVGWHFLLQEIFLTQGLNPCLPHLLHWQADSLLLSQPEKCQKGSGSNQQDLCRFDEIINQDCLAQHPAKLVLNKWQLILWLLYQIVVSCLLCTNTVLGIERYKKEIIYNLCPRAESWQIIFWKRPNSLGSVGLLVSVTQFCHCSRQAARTANKWA